MPLVLSQWLNLPRTICHCESTKGIHYHSLEALATDGAVQDASQASVQAETCDECHHYIKIVRMERELNVDPVADDLASLTLDILVSEAGYEAHGVNLLLLSGGEEAPGEPAIAPPSNRSN